MRGATTRSTAPTSPTSRRPPRRRANDASITTHTPFTHSHTLSPSTAIHPARPHGRSKLVLDAQSCHALASPRPHPARSRCKTVYDFVINAIVLLRSHTSPLRRAEAWAGASETDSSGALASRVLPPRGRGRAAGGETRLPVSPQTPSAPITARKTVTHIPTLIRLTASDQPGLTAAACAAPALPPHRAAPNTHSTREMRRGCAQISTRSATTRQMQ